MTTEQIMELDYRESESKEIIQKVLKKIKPLSKYSVEEDVVLKDIEKVIFVICKKYDTRVVLRTDVFANDNNIVWRAAVIYETDISIVYGISIYEIMAKVAIRIYSFVRNK